MSRVPPTWIPNWPQQSDSQNDETHLVPMLLRKGSMIIAHTGERRHAERTADDGSQPHGPVFTETDEEEETAAAQDAARGIGEIPFPQSLSATISNRTWDVLKCTLAYTLASTFVYVPFLSSLIGSTASKHSVATISVYFHPARPVGGMLQAMVFVSAMLCYSLTVSLLSLGVAHIFADMGLPQYGGLVLVVLFCGVALGAIGYFKVNMANPTFDTSCSAAVIFLVTVLLREDDLHSGVLSLRQLSRYLFMALMGITISAVVCLTISTVWATDLLQKDLVGLTTKSATVLEFVLERFVRGKAVSGPEYNRLLKQLNNNITTAKTHLNQARYELVWSFRRPQYEALEMIVESIYRLSVHLGGLAHSTNVQAALLSPQKRPLATQASGEEFHSRDVSAGVLFHAFVHHLGPPMSAFAATLSDILRAVPSKPSTGPRFDRSLGRHINPKFQSSLQAAIDLYSSARENALQTVYGHRIFGPKGAASTVDDEAVVATCGSFSYLLLDLGEELQQLVELILYYEQVQDAPTAEEMPDPPSAYEEMRASSNNQSQPFSRLSKALYPSRKPLAPTMGFRIWRALRLLRRPDVRYALRVGIGAFLIALPAFVPAWRPHFKAMRGEWAVITYMIIMARNLGAMTANIPLRVIGTCTGALLAVGAYQISQNPFFLLVAGSGVSALCFYIILGQQRPSLGRFILLTFNLVCLFTYSLHVNDHDDEADDPHAPISNIALHRVLAVLTGVLWAVLVSVTILPYGARLALRNTFSTQWMRMGMVWKADPLATVPRRGGNDDHGQQFNIRGIYGEHQLQDTMLELQALLDNAPHEFRLRGSFDPGPYQTLLHATQLILDAYHSLGILSSQQVAASSKELELIEYTSAERKELCGALFLHFYTAAASIRIGFPVPEQLPVPRHAITRMFQKLQEHRRRLVENPEVDSDSEDFVLFYSYLMVTASVIDQLSVVNNVLRDLYGALAVDMFAYA